MLGGGCLLGLWNEPAPWAVTHWASRLAWKRSLSDKWISWVWAPLEGFWIQWRCAPPVKRCLSPYITGRGAQAQASTCVPHILSPGWLCSEHVCFICSLCHVMCDLSVMLPALLSNPLFKMLSKIRCSRHFFTTWAIQSIFQAEEIQTCGTWEKTQSIKYFSCNQENSDLGFLEPR